MLSKRLLSVLIEAEVGDDNDFVVEKCAGTKEDKAGNFPRCKLLESKQAGQNPDSERARGINRRSLCSRSILGAGNAERVE